MRPEGVLEASREPDRAHWVISTVGFTTMTVGLVLALTAGVVAAIGLFWVGGLVGLYGIAGPQARAASWLAGRFGSPGRLGAASLARSAAGRRWSGHAARSFRAGVRRPGASGRQAR